MKNDDVKADEVIRFGEITYEVIRVHGEEDGPREGEIDVGRHGPDDPIDGAGKPIGLALTIDVVVWHDLVKLAREVSSCRTP